MELLAKHIILTEGDSLEACRKKVMHFFEQTPLVRYDNIVLENDGCSGEDAFFNKKLEQALESNKAALQGFIDELGAAGFDKRLDLLKLQQGYQSKILHIIAHFLDGFIGIDSAFYSLVDDSHWLTDETRSRITNTPSRFKLFFLKCYSLSPREAVLLH